MPSRNRIWDPTKEMPILSLTKEDENIVITEFNKKCQALNGSNGPLGSKSYTPDTSKDIYISKYYKHDYFTFFNRNQRNEFYESVKGERLRIQSLYFLDLIKKERGIVKKLIDRYHSINIDDNDNSNTKNADTNAKKERLCIKELIKRKKINIDYMDNIRNSIAEIVLAGEELVEYYSKCYLICKANENKH